MRRFRPFLMLLALGCAGAHLATAPAESGPPAWVKARIEQYQKAPVANPPQSIWRYRYQDRMVYYIPPQCCDKMGELYDDQGTQIASPGGGLRGKGDGRCPDFMATRTEETLVWQDPRKR